ncbi:MAG: sigma-70 family RNA polymerase sigma factor [Candidatus Rokubacteria bacterium]|nr:sigma-70 family RNA polymerase sigma factor [Candidatus Rokubacteria bacterium]
MADERELMARVKEGEQSALELLFARWEGPLFAFFYRLGCPPSRVEDLTEEVLVTIYRRRHSYDLGRPFTPWLYGIARLVWKDYLRHHGREVAHTALIEAAEQVPPTESDPSEMTQLREEADTVRRAIQDLPEEQREAILLRHYHGLSYEEIAEALQIPVGTVKWRIHEAVRRLDAPVVVAQRQGD